jgi:hypothetical protein
MTEFPASVVQPAARASSINIMVKIYLAKSLGRYLDSHLPGGVQSDWRFQGGSIEACFKGNRYLIYYNSLVQY